MSSVLLKLSWKNLSVCGVGGLNESAFSGPTFGRIRMKKARMRAPIPGFSYLPSHSFR